MYGQTIKTTSASGTVTTATTTLTHDVNGNVLLDTTPTHTITYTTDSYGQILSRSDTTGATHVYYYFDGHRIGDVGNDGGAVVNYARAIAGRSTVPATGAEANFDQSYIDHLGRLLERLNGYITKHQIPAFEVDRGRETHRAPVATLADVAQGNSLDGVRTPTTKF